MPTDIRFDDLDLREEAPSREPAETDSSTLCTTGCGCNSRNTCSTYYC